LQYPKKFLFNIFDVIVILDIQRKKYLKIVLKKKIINFEFSYRMYMEGKLFGSEFDKVKQVIDFANDCIREAISLECILFVCLFILLLSLFLFFKFSIT
jgi:hypothetical protein